jgi:RNA polymerase sigma factor (sigma-70 family)
MSAQAILNAIDVVAGVLPFRIDDYRAVNDRFVAAAGSTRSKARRDVDVWTYCFVSRYFALQFVRSGQPALSDIDRLIERALQKIRRGSPRLRRPVRYTAWVNTVCRNAYLNYVRSYHLEWLEDLENIVAEAKPSDNYDLGLLVETLSRVIDELPPFLQDVARHRFVGGLTYREISARTGRPVPTLRSYANKAVRLIRQHPLLREILTELTS